MHRHSPLARARAWARLVARRRGKQADMGLGGVLDAELQGIELGRRPGQAGGGVGFPDGDM